MMLKKITAFAAAFGLAFGICIAPPVLPESETIYAQTSENDFTIENISGEKYITEYKGSGGDIVIPADISGIGEEAFSFNDNVTGITFPASCQKVEMMSFFYCTGLKRVTFEGDMKKVGFMSFLGCTALEKVTFMGDIVSDDSESFYSGLAANAFMGCRSLKTVEFAEDSRIDIMERAVFMDCANLTEVKLPREVGRICEYAFMNCPELTRLEIPSMTELEDFAVGYMYDEETEEEIKADGIAYVRADLSFNYDDPNVSEIVQKPITLAVYKDSPAEKYAAENSIAYEYVQETEENPSTGKNTVLTEAAFTAAATALFLIVFLRRKAFEPFKIRN